MCSSSSSDNSIFVFLTFRLFLLSLLSLASLSAKQPEITVIYTDDHGWPDVGPAGIHADLKTPHLDALAAAGVRASSAPVPSLLSDTTASSICADQPSAVRKITSPSPRRFAVMISSAIA